MTHKTETGGPAFPLAPHGVQTLGLHITGMTLRDYFAAKALPPLVAFAPEGTFFGVGHDMTNLAYAMAAYAMADAMLEARK